MPRSLTRSRRSASLLTAVLLAGSLGACTGGDQDAAEPAPAPTAPPPVTVAVDVAKVAGEGLKPAARRRIGKDVQTLLQGYVDAAFLGDYPRSDFEAALTAFTAGAAQEGRRDLELLTGAGFGEVQAVTADKLDVQLSVLAPRGKPAGGTARVRFDLDVDGSPVTYTGRMMLTTTRQDVWKIFGYELRRNDKRDDLGAGASGEDG